MREIKEREFWNSLKKSYANEATNLFVIGKASLNLAAGCTVISGRNGTGKSRLLRDIHAAHPDSTVLLDMHHLCEQALAVLRSRTDLEEMAKEFDSLGPDDGRIDDIQRVVGRKYESVDWYALEIAPNESDVADQFRWAGDEDDEPLVPFFQVRYRSRTYTSKDMGLGEFSTHFLFWIIDQYREKKDLTLLLDEPDAYLPPVGVESLLSRLLGVCLGRRWRVIVATHSEEMIARALEEESLLVLRLDDEGDTVALDPTSAPSVVAELLPRPPVNRVLFVEDESACHLLRALLDAHDARLSRATSVIWGDGHGYLRELHKSMPRPARSELKFGFVLDGDQQGTLDSLDRRWPVLFLPTAQDPDTLFQAAVVADPAKLAGRLGTDETSLRLLLDAIEAADPHDWVNQLGDRFGRAIVLRGLATLWAEANAESAETFVVQLEASY